MDRNSVALSLLPSIIALTPTAGSADTDLRTSAVNVAFAWADSFLEVTLAKQDEINRKQDALNQFL